MIRCAYISLIAITALIGFNMVRAKADMYPYLYSFDFYNEYGDEYAYSDWKWKENDSSSKIHYQSGRYDVIMSIVAYDDGIVENIRTQQKRYSVGMFEEIYNWVKESGYDKAVLRGQATVDGYYDVHGIWTPDTVE